MMPCLVILRSALQIFCTGVTSSHIDIIASADCTALCVADILQYLVGTLWWPRWWKEQDVHTHGAKRATYCDANFLAIC
jgi:hypothetical protein